MERGDKIQRNSSRAIKHKCLKLMAFDNVKNAVIFPIPTRPAMIMWS